MNIKLDKYNPLMMYLSPASIPQIVAHIQDYLVKHPILSVETIAEIIVQSLQEHPELINGEAIPISADSEQSIKAYIDALPGLDTYTKAEINALLLGKQDTLTFDQAPTPGSSNPVTSSGIIAAMSALQSALETQISAKADRASTYTKTQVDTLLEDKADADDVYSKNTMDAKLLEVNTDIDNLEDALGDQSQQILNVQNGLAYIVGNTNTTGSTLASGTFVYVKGHSTIAEGLRKVTASIPVNGSITTNNTEDCTVGCLNALNSKIIYRDHNVSGITVPSGKEAYMNIGSVSGYYPITVTGVFAGEHATSISVLNPTKNPNDGNWIARLHNSHSEDVVANGLITSVWLKR